MSALLEVEGLHAGYVRTEVLRGIDLAVQPGEAVALLGANGAGKTTLIRVLSGLLRPMAGRVRFAGEEIAGLSPAAIVARGLIQVPEGRHVFPDLSVHENLLLGAYRRGRANRPASLERVLTIFPRLRERLHQGAGTLSGGEQAMLAIGRALMAEPVLLVLDEPSLGLSPLLVEEMFALIGRLGQGGLSMLLVEQNVVQSLEVASRALVLENGAVAMAGEPAAIRADPRLREAYLGLG